MIVRQPRDRAAVTVLVIVKRMTYEDFYKELREALIRRRRDGRVPTRARINPQQAKLIEGNFGIEHSNGEMRLEGVLLVPDAGVPFTSYALDD